MVMRFEIPGFSDGDAAAQVHFERIAGDQIKVTRVEGNVFGSNAVKQNVILTWSES